MAAMSSRTQVQRLLVFGHGDFGFGFHPAQGFSKRQGLRLLAEARERGEDVASVAAALAAAESEEDMGALPPLEELVQKLPAELRATLDDLFRAKFVKVMRVRKKDLPV